MMTRSGKTMLVLHALVLIGCTRAATVGVSDGRLVLGLTLYAVAGTALTSLLREINRAELHEAGRPLPYWMCWAKARMAASPMDFCCYTYLDTLGEMHAEMCPERHDNPPVTGDEW